MAKRGGFFGGGKRHGGSDDPDNDGFPGNSHDSKQFAETYDPRSETETSNRVPVPSQLYINELEARQADQDAEDRRNANDVQSAVHFFPSMGKFIIPEENTWAAHAQLVKDDRQALYFNPDKYIYFDKIIADKIGNPALTDPNNKDYKKYEGLRTNLEVLRNDIIGIFLNDGAFDPGDEKYIPTIQNIAETIGDGLANDKWYKRPFSNAVSLDVANVEGVGAREIYQYLLDLQSTRGVLHDTAVSFGLEDRSWNLPPLSQTPYSPANLSAPAPIKTFYTPAELEDRLDALQRERERSDEDTRTGRVPATTNDRAASDARDKEGLERAIENSYAGRRDDHAQDQGRSSATRQRDENSSPSRSESTTEQSSARSDDAQNEPNAEQRQQKAREQALQGNSREPVSTQQPADTRDEQPQKPQGHTDDILPVYADAPDHEKMRQQSMATIDRSAKLRSPETMEQPSRDASVEEARIILRWLKNLRGSDRDTQEWLDQGTPAEQVSKAEAVGRLVEIYAGELHKAEQLDPDIRKSLMIQDANDAAGSLSVSLGEHSLAMLPPDHPEAARLEQILDNTPEPWEHRLGHPVERLLDTLVQGIERATGTAVDDKSPADRLLETSNQVQEAAYQLRTVDTMEPPAREESVELAREILRKLRNLQFADQTIEELIESGRPEDKAAFTQQVGDMVDAYKTLLQEASAGNPELMQDPKIMEANSAVGGLAHALKLLAAKEIPVSMAASQQISADITQMPEDWKKLGQQTIGRLTSSMEGGLEKAVGDMEQQQQQQQDDDMAQDVIATALASADQGKRKKRKRRSSGRSGGGGGKQRKQNADMSADDQQLKQGRFREEPNMAAVRGLKKEDIDAIKALGDSLRDINNQMGNGLAAVNTDTKKISPNDRKFGSRTADQRDKLQNSSLKI